MASTRVRIYFPLMPLFKLTLKDVLLLTPDAGKRFRPHAFLLLASKENEMSFTPFQVLNNATYLSMRRASSFSFAN